MKSNKLKVNNSLIKYLPFEFNDTHIKNAITDLITQKVDSIFFANNTLALKSLPIIKSLKINIPKHIAVISFDDIDVFEYTYTSISAIRQPIEKICKQSFEILIKNIQRASNKVTHKELSTELILRESTNK